MQQAEGVSHGPDTLTSEVAVAAANTKGESVAVQFVTGWHTRSWNELPFADDHWVELHTLFKEHTRSLVRVGRLLS